MPKTYIEHPFFELWSKAKQTLINPMKAWLFHCLAFARKNESMKSSNRNRDPIDFSILLSRCILRVEAVPGSSYRILFAIRTHVNLIIMKWRNIWINIQNIWISTLNGQTIQASLYEQLRTYRQVWNLYKNEEKSLESWAPT